jgi:hypothetical protein
MHICRKVMHTVPAWDGLSLRSFAGRRRGQRRAAGLGVASLGVFPELKAFYLAHRQHGDLTGNAEELSMNVEKRRILDMPGNLA